MYSHGFLQCFEMRWQQRTCNMVKTCATCSQNSLQEHLMCLISAGRGSSIAFPVPPWWCSEALPVDGQLVDIIVTKHRCIAHSSMFRHVARLFGTFCALSPLLPILQFYFRLESGHWNETCVYTLLRGLVIVDFRHHMPTFFTIFRICKIENAAKTILLPVWPQIRTFCMWFPIMMHFTTFWAMFWNFLMLCLLLCGLCIFLTNCWLLII